MILGELVNKLDCILKASSLAYSWDNVGLMVGEKSSDIKKITLALELSQEVIDEAEKNNTDLIITHHPLIFSPLKNVTDGDIKQKYIIELIKKNIALYSAHTNFDRIYGGLNDYVINMLKVKDIYPLEDREDVDSLGRVATLEKKMKLSEFVSYLEDVFDAPYIRYVSKDDRMIEKIALVTGSGSEFMEICEKENVDAFITGDLKYHQAQDIYQMNGCIIDLGHYDSEKFFGRAMKQFLVKNGFDEEKLVISDALENPFCLRRQLYE